MTYIVSLHTSNLKNRLEIGLEILDGGELHVGYFMPHAHLDGVPARDLWRHDRHLVHERHQGKDIATPHAAGAGKQ